MKKLISIFAAALMVACGSTADLNVMTFNVRYDNPEDGNNNWKFRKERVADVIKDNKIDVFGTQEVLINQYNDLKGLLPEYASVGVGREDGKEKGEFNAVFYRTDRFTLLDSGTFWLSETPEVAGSLGWDGACERLVTWTVLKEKGGVELLFINTHLDHMGEVARREGVSLLIDRIGKLAAGRPVVLTGDFNAEPESSVIEHVLTSGIFNDSKAEAATKAGTDWSFADYGSIPEAERPLIDYIFVSKDIKVNHYEVLPDHNAEGFVSDHAPLKANIHIEK